MRKEFNLFQIAVCVLSLLGFLGLRAYAQDGDHNQDADHKKDHPDGIVHDWSRHHVVYPRVGPIQSLFSLERDPRAILSWQEAEREDWHREKDRIKDGGKDKDRDEDGDGNHGHSHGPNSGIQRDWSISLGTGTTAPAMYPAKYGFNVSATPDCTNDFVVFPVNVNGSGSQPNIVAFDNLYRGPSGTPGICNLAPNAGVDDGVSATVIWSYNVQIDFPSGQVSTSPALSLDGTKVAFVENDLTNTTFTQSYFHVLAPHRGDGVSTNLQSVTSPAGITGLCNPPTVITHCIVHSAPVANSGTDAFVQLGSILNSDTLSSPFIEYNSDMAYVGDDTGKLYRIKNVFCTTIACTGGGSPGPSLDTNWGAGGALSTGCSGKLTGPVVSGTGNVFVGCSDGKLFGFTSAGLALSNSPLTVGNGSATGGIVDPPLVDVVNGHVYVVSGNSSGGSSVLVQASATDLSSPVVATLGVGGVFNLHTPALNNAYFSSGFSSVPNVHGTVNPPATGTTGSTSNWQIYEWGNTGVSTSLTALYGVGFDSSHVMTSGPAANFVQVTGSVNTELSPVTELLNGSTDQIFTSALETSFPNVIVYNVTDFPGLFPNDFPPTNGTSNAVGATAAEGSGTSGIIVDNVSSSAQASSIYFGVLGSNTAVKLTQSGLK